MRPHLSERLADLRADLVQNPASEAEFNLLELVYLDALRAHIQGLTQARLSHLHSAQAEAMAAAEAVWQSQTALLAEQRRAAEASREAYARALASAGHGPVTTEIGDMPPFYFAEDYHQQYLAKNPGGYCGLGGTGVSCPVGLGTIAG